MKIRTPWRLLLTLGVALSIAGCSSTQLNSTTKQRGAMLQEIKSEPKLEKEHTSLDMSAGSITVRVRRDYQEQTETHYQILERRNYTTKTHVPTVGGILFIPISVACLPVGLLMLEPHLCFGTLTETKWRTHHTDTLLNGKVDIDRKTVNRTENLIIKNRQVDVYVGSHLVKSAKTDSNGKISYTLGEILEVASLKPERLINNEGLEVRAVSNGVHGSYRYPNSSIPESFFSRAYNADQAALQEANKARHDNCILVSQSKREFFECFFQRGLHGS